LPVREDRDTIEVKGFLNEPRLAADGSVYHGRMSLPAVQWTGSGTELVGTVTVTAEQIADAAESRLIWTDQSVQRGIQPTAPSGVARELALSDGYPDPRIYIFDASNADDITNKLLIGDRLFLNPLVWNLRPGAFEAYSGSDNNFTLYAGRIYLPDSHHRHQAILKAVRAYRDRPGAYPAFALSRQFKLEIYFLDREDEGNYFFDKNQRPRSTALSKAYDLTTQDDLSVLAKKVLDHTRDLDKGVNRATDRLSKKAPHFVTLSTLREVMRTFAGGTEVEENELEGLALIASSFFKLLIGVRPELRVDTSHVEREATLASAAVMMHGYAQLMRDYNLDVARLGGERASGKWQNALQRLSPAVTYVYGDWAGDYLSRENPLWAELGIVRVDPDTHRVTVSNTGGTRARAGRALRIRIAEPGDSE
jgi:hypothetical protein